jgi:hypothetical protein
VPHGSGSGPSAPRVLALKMPLEYYQCNTNAGQDRIMNLVNRLFLQTK